MNLLIVGGNSGIGACLAKQAFESGNHVTLVTRTQPTHSFFNSHFFWDVLSNQPFPEVTYSVDAVVYCPGTIRLKPFLRLTEQDFLTDWQIHFMGAVKTLQALFPKLKSSPNASAVLFSSVAASTGMPFHASVAACKSAIEGLTRSLAAEWTPTIRINAIAPALHDTPLAASLLNTPEKSDAAARRHPLNRIGNPEHLAALTLFLLSEQASFMTGQVISADGGISSVRL